MEFKNLYTYWLDKDTFCFSFDGGIDIEGDEYTILCEYHADEDKYIFAKCYEYDTTLTDFTDEQKKCIKDQMQQYIKRGVISK